MGPCQQRYSRRKVRPYDLRCGGFAPLRSARGRRCESLQLFAEGVSRAIGSLGSKHAGAGRSLRARGVVMGVQNDWAHGHPIMRSVTSYDALFDTGSSIGSAPSFKGGFTRKGPRALVVEGPVSPAAAASPAESSPVQRAARARAGRAPSKQTHSPQAQPSDSRTSFREMLAHRHQTTKPKRTEPKPTGTRPCLPCHKRAALRSLHAFGTGRRAFRLLEQPLSGRRSWGFGFCSAAPSASRACAAPVRSRCPTLAQARPEGHPLPPIHQTGAARRLEGASPRRCAHPASSHRRIL